MTVQRIFFDRRLAALVKRGDYVLYDRDVWWVEGITEHTSVAASGARMTHVELRMTGVTVHNHGLFVSVLRHEKANVDVRVPALFADGYFAIEGLHDVKIRRPGQHLGFEGDEPADPWERPPW